MSRASTTRFAVLAALAIGPMTGAEVRRLIGESIGHFWSESYGQLYPALAAMTRDGLVDRREDGRRTVYTVTDAGMAALRAWGEGPLPDRPARNDLLLRLFTGRHLAPDRLLELVRDARARQEASLRRLRLAEEAPPEDRAHPDFPYWDATLRFGLLVGEAVLRWCDETERMLVQRASPDGTGPTPVTPPHEEDA
jgi:DNA-binding PadR family transcriptional regulator